VEFQVAGRELGQVTGVEFQGRKALGCYRLEVAVTFRINEYPKADHGRGLFLGGGDLHFFDVLVGRLTPDTNSTCAVAGRSHPEARFHLSCELDGRRIEAIEEKRSGQGVPARLDLVGIVNEKDGFRTSSLQEHVTISQSDWLATLQGMGYQDYLLIEVPLGPKEESAQLNEAMRQLRDAQNLLMKGYYDQVVATCRKAAEALEKDLGLKKFEKKELDAYFDNQRALDKHDRARFLLRSLQVFCHPSHHADKVSRDITWTRADAVLAMTEAAQLVAWFGNSSGQVGP